MRERRFIKRASAVLLLTALLGGCGIIPMVAQQTTAAALRPVTAAAQIVKTDLQLMNNLARSATAQSAAQTREITMAMQSAPSPVYAASTAPRTIGFSKPKRTKDDAKAIADWDILPAGVLAQLTKDQAALQRAAQREAATAVVGETIFWKLEGREGTAVTESENKMGAFTCRTFVQTLKLDDTVEKASATACRTETTGWTRSF